MLWHAVKMVPKQRVKNETKESKDKKRAIKNGDEEKETKKETKV